MFLATLQHLKLESICQWSIMVAMNIPLPVLLIHSIFYFPIKEIIDRRRYNHVRKYYDDISLLTFEQLQQLFPGKNAKALSHIIADLDDRYIHRKYNADKRAERKRNYLKKYRALTNNGLVPYRPSLIYFISLGTQI
jgi:hypothetical protein